jgi:quercetin dioxygenase-like cupin family protein
MDLKVTPWPDDTLPTEDELQDYFENQELKVLRWSQPSQGTMAGHTHGYHKVLFVLEGTVKFEFPTRHQTINLKVGDRLDLPAGVRHNVEAGDAGVRCIEAHVY